MWKLICCFGFPCTIITDNGRQFTNKKLVEFYKNLGIKHITNFVEHPQTSDQAKVVNKTIVVVLKQCLGTWKERGWMNFHRSFGVIIVRRMTQLVRRSSTSRMVLMSCFLWRWASLFFRRQLEDANLNEAHLREELDTFKKNRNGNHVS